MAKKNYSVAEVLSIVDEHGIGLAITTELDAKNIKDEDLSDLWERASELLSEIKDYLDENGDSIDDADDDADSEDDDYN
jgi:hypothetical protein